MQKTISLSIDTTNDESIINYNNIRKGDTLLLNIKVYQTSASLDLTGQSMHIVLKKPDGYSVEKIVNNVTGNNFLVAFDVQATLAIGDVEGIIEISDSNGSDITNTFIFEVKENPASNIVIQSSNQIETLSQIVALINSYNSNADNLAVQNQLALQHESTLGILNTNANNTADRLETDITNGTATAVRLESDIVTGNQVDANLKTDIYNGTNLHNNLLIDITNGNDILQKLPGLNFDTILSYISLFEVITANIPIDNENDIDITNENDITITM